jgi:hypothetical protein
MTFIGPVIHVTIQTGHCKDRLGYQGLKQAITEILADQNDEQPGEGQ